MSATATAVDTKATPTPVVAVKETAPSKPTREKKDDYELSRSYQFWRLFGVLLTWITHLLPMLPSPFSTVQHGRRGLKFRNKKLVDILMPGNHYRNPCTEHIWSYDTDVVRVQTVSTTSNRSKDGVEFDVENTISWDIRDLWAFCLKFKSEYNDDAINEPRAADLMEKFTLETIRHTISTNLADTFNVCDPKMIEAMKDTVQKRANEYGIRLKDLVIADIDRVKQTDPTILNQAMMERKNANALMEAKIKAEVAAIEAASLKAQVDALGPEVFQAVLKAKYMEKLAGTTNTKTVIMQDGAHPPVVLNV